MILIINLFLYVRQRETREFLGEVSSENDCDEQAKETRCTCGKNKKNKSVSDIFCVSGKCPCHKVNHSCTRSCRCYNCKNTCNSNEVVKVTREAVGAELDKRAKGTENQMQVTSRVKTVSASRSVRV
ncbi:unnamed protein product [Pocillopora meandrina]|uniref:CRC domain-containing protein n=1 Tax=Pocillopora meandrina TaxID=46732 RepID=A0AAU9Y1X0_9CNID|nr:unnamed protein product [Pocillopora meandrina]